MSLRLELYVEGREWVKVGELLPGDRHGSISDNRPDGKRDIYLFQCEVGNSKSVIYRSTVGLDFEVKHLRVTSTQGLEVIKELTSLQPTYEMEVKTDQSSASKRIRFTHK